jgi:uncharacterized protein
VLKAVIDDLGDSASVKGLLKLDVKPRKRLKNMMTNRSVRSHTSDGLTIKYTPLGAYRIALKLARKRQYRKALTYLNDAASRGNVHAIYALATWYLFGRGVKRDPAKAVQLLKQASRRNHAKACFDLAVCFETGNGTRVDRQRAFRLYMRATQCGDMEAALEVGRMLYWGIGVHKSQKEASQFILRAARSGIDEARFLMGVICESGDGIPQNFGRARRWYAKVSNDSKWYKRANDSIHRLKAGATSR